MQILWFSRRDRIGGGGVIGGKDEKQAKWRRGGGGMLECRKISSRPDSNFDFSHQIVQLNKRKKSAEIPTCKVTRRLHFSENVAA